uniref:Ig-like domain-containing protein n=1 Tax=Astyanax mexicanus TaxID=7994 RepID=A0A8B9JGP3_ASTMX
IFFTPLHIKRSSQAALNPQPLVLSVELGKAAPLHCSLRDQSSAEVRMWYKQRLEHSPLEVASKLKGRDSEISPHPRFKVQKNTTGFSLTIENVVKEDEGMYFCGTGEGKTLKFSNSTFLTVTGNHLIT